MSYLSDTLGFFWPGEWMNSKRRPRKKVQQRNAATKLHVRQFPKPTHCSECGVWWMPHSDIQPSFTNSLLVDDDQRPWRCGCCSVLRRTLQWIHWTCVWCATKYRATVALQSPRYPTTCCARRGRGLTTTKADGRISHSRWRLLYTPSH